jgi:hypothetical protein
VKGNLEFQNQTIDFKAPTMTALAVSVDGKKAWFAGVSKGGKTFVAYVEDNGEPGSKDKFRLWVDGVEVTAVGGVPVANMQIHKP